MNKESEKKKEKLKRKKQLKGRKSGLASTHGGAAWAPASIEVGLVTCTQVIRPCPKESWEYVGGGAKTHIRIDLTTLGTGPWAGPNHTHKKATCFSLKVIMSTFYQKYVFLRHDLTSLASGYIGQVASDTSPG